MATATIKVQRTITLVLSLTEASWIEQMAQNWHSVGICDEAPLDRESREAIYHAIEKALDLHKGA